MLPGTIVIANDLLGFVESAEGNYVQVRSKDGVLHKIRAAACTEICNPAALALMFYRKLMGRINVKD